MTPDTYGAFDQGYQVAKRVLEAEVWMVRYLGNVIGPISLELVERGIEAGKIPGGAEIAHRELQQWRSLAELYPQLQSASATALPPAALPPAAQPLAAQPPAAQPQDADTVVPQPSQAPSRPPRRSLPPPSLVPSERIPFDGRAFSSPAPRPVPVPTSAPAAAAVAVEMPVVPPPPPVPPAPPPSYRFPEEPVSIPKQGMLAALFG